MGQPSWIGGRQDPPVCGWGGEGLGRYARITVRADQMGGVPCIRGLRIPVATVVKLLATGYGEPEILRDDPDPHPEGIREALACAAEAVDERQSPPHGGAGGSATRVGTGAWNADM